VIRPPRAEYEPEALGPAEFSYAGVSVVRHDVELVNKRGLRLCASLWQRRDAVGTHGWPACVYLHGNASCRTEATLVASEVLQRGAALFAFDFAGCGLSDGDYITLGHFEKDDVEAAVTWLRTVAGAGAVALWGRSMGATSALLHAARDGSLAGLICDSPFSSVEAVSLEAWKPSIMASLASAHTPKDTSQRARRDQSGTSRRRESKQPVDVGTKRAAAGRLAPPNRQGRRGRREHSTRHTVFLARL